MLKHTIAIFIISLGFLIPGTAFAEVVNSPFYTDVSAQPGERIRVPVTLRNKANKPIVLDIYIHDFISQKNTKEPLFTANPDYSIKSWFRDATISPKITVPAQSTVIYEAVLDVPYGAESKTYFGGIFFINNKAGQETSIATQAFVTVGGKQPSVTMSDILYKTKQSFNKQRANVSFTLTNNGQIIFTIPKEAAIIEILDENKNIINKQDIGSELRILPQSSQNFTIELTSLVNDQARTAQVTITNTNGKKISKAVAIPLPQPNSTTVSDNTDTSRNDKPNTADVLVMPALVTGAFVAILIISAAVYKVYLTKKNSAKPKKNNKT